MRLFKPQKTDVLHIYVAISCLFLIGVMGYKLIFFFRKFIENEYVGIKQKNPSFPILIRECSNVEPRIYARYGEFLSVCDSTLIN